jgi:hypothetical protein
MGNSTAAALGVAYFLACSKRDGRSFRRPISRRFSNRITTWREVDSDETYNDGWFQRQFRCSKSAFNKIVERVEARWHMVNTVPHWNAVFSIRDRVAATMHYLTHSDGCDQSALVFGTACFSIYLFVKGMGKSSVHRYVRQVIEVINLYTNEI